MSDELTALSPTEPAADDMDLATFEMIAQEIRQFIDEQAQEIRQFVDDRFETFQPKPSSTDLALLELAAAVRQQNGTLQRLVEILGAPKTLVMENGKPVGVRVDTTIN